jgi:peptide/nickel transport system ATP-binding protein
MTASPVIELDALEKHFTRKTSFLKTIKHVLGSTSLPRIRAVDGVTLNLDQNQVQGVIGESGCGKTTLLKTVIGLHEPTNGDIRFDGRSIHEFDKQDWKEFRRRVQVVFQDPFNSMDPKFTVRATLKEQFEIHDISYEESDFYDVLEQVKLQPPEKYIDRYPHNLSGGEKQRVSIARALILEPDVILADEPVSMLDVSTQAAILKDLQELTKEMGVSMMYISHDLSTVSYVCDYVNVMYLGRIVEKGRTEELLQEPRHPYTKELINAIPIPDPHYDREPTTISGTPSDPSDLPSGCRFKDRCPERMDICDVTPRHVSPESDSATSVACHLYYDHKETAEEVSIDE